MVNKNVLIEFVLPIYNLLISSLNRCLRNFHSFNKGNGYSFLGYLACYLYILVSYLVSFLWFFIFFKIKKTHASIFR